MGLIRGRAGPSGTDMANALHGRCVVRSTGTCSSSRAVRQELVSVWPSYAQRLSLTRQPATSARITFRKRTRLTTCRERRASVEQRRVVHVSVDAWRRPNASARRRRWSGLVSRAVIHERRQRNRPQLPSLLAVHPLASDGCAGRCSVGIRGRIAATEVARHRCVCQPRRTIEACALSPPAVAQRFRRGRSGGPSAWLSTSRAGATRLQTNQREARSVTEKKDDCHRGQFIPPGGDPDRSAERPSARAQRCRAAWLPICAV